MVSHHGSFARVTRPSSRLVLSTSARKAPATAFKLRLHPHRATLLQAQCLPSAIPVLPCRKSAYSSIDCATIPRLPSLVAVRSRAVPALSAVCALAICGHCIYSLHRTAEAAARVDARHDARPACNSLWRGSVPAIMTARACACVICVRPASLLNGSLW